MSGQSPTFDSLIALGFERKKTRDGLEGVGYRFVHLDLDAVHVTNTYAQDVVLLSGVIDTGHTLATIEDQIPNDLTSALEAAVWVSHALRYHRSDLEPLPEWYVEGERRWDLLPRIHQMREAQERQLAYMASPRCYIDRAYARLLRRKLLDEFSRLCGETEITFSFDGRVLSIALKEHVHEVIASGDCWPSSHQVIVSPESKLPARFESPRVEVGVFDGYVSFDRLRLGRLNWSRESHRSRD